MNYRTSDGLRQYNDSVRAYERLKQSGSCESALHDALNKQNILKYQIEEAQTVRDTLANQAIEALEALQATQKEFDSFGRQV